MEHLHVRQATATDLKSTFLDLSIKGRRIGKNDVDFFYEVDNTGFFIGELNGVPVSCVSIVKYGDKLAYLGFYFVSSEYRGQGIGLKTFQTALASLDKSYTCALYCLQEMVPTYKRSGFTVTTSLIKRYEITPSIALKSLHHPVSLEGVTIKSIDEVSFEDVSKYDSFVFGAPHHKYLKGLLSTPDHHGFVAVDGRRTSNVVGLIVVREAILDNGYIIAPLFANTADIAKCLLRVVFELMISEAPNEKVSLDMDIGFNPFCTEVAASFGGVPQPYTITTMYTKETPAEMKKELIYVVTSLAVG